MSGYAGRTQKRIRRVEEAAADLLHSARRFNDDTPSSFQVRCRDLELLDLARRYGRAITILSRGK